MTPHPEQPVPLVRLGQGDYRRELVPDVRRPGHLIERKPPVQQTPSIWRLLLLNLTTRKAS